MLPLVLVGSFVGVMVANILPEAVLTIILAILLFYLTYDSLSKAIGLWKKETIALAKEAADAYQPLAGSKQEQEMARLLTEQPTSSGTIQEKPTALINHVSEKSDKSDVPMTPSKMEQIDALLASPGKI